MSMWGDVDHNPDADAHLGTRGESWDFIIY